MLKPPVGAGPNGDPINAAQISCWLMNEGAGTDVVDVAGGRNGAIVGTGTTWSTDDEGAPCLAFNQEASSAVIVEDWSNFSATEEMTILVRLLANSYKNQSAFHTNGDGSNNLNFHCFYSGNAFVWDAGNNSYSRLEYTSAGLDDAWQTFVLTASALNDRKRIWRNGSIEAETTGGLTFTPDNSDLYIGAFAPNPPDIFDGKITVMRVWGRELSDGEIGDVTSDPYKGLGAITQSHPELMIM